MQDEGEFVDDPDTYRRLVGKVIYLTITLPNISYAFSIVSHFMTSPRVPHMNAIIHILKYLKNALGRDLFYWSSGHLRIEGYIDADWTGSPSDRKSTTGYCTFIGGNLVTWRSKKQSVLTRSSAEAEYRVMAHITCELTWLRTILQEFGLSVKGPTPLYCDNERNPLVCLSKALNLPSTITHKQHTIWTIQSNRMDPFGFMKKTY